MTAKHDVPDDARILQALTESAKGPLKAKDLARALGVRQEAHKALRARLREMEARGAVYRVKGDRYAAPGKINLVVGRLDTTRAGDGFVVPDAEGGRDVFVPSADLASAMDGDQVVVRVERQPPGRNPVGRIIKVLERAHPRVVGLYRRDRHLAYVVPKGAGVDRDVLVPDGQEGAAQPGDVVVVRITHFGDRKLNPLGEVETVLGRLGDPGVDVLAILHEHGLPTEFPDEVLKAAEAVARGGRPRLDAECVDRRDLLVFTIDPADAKDHDDALSVGAAPGGWEVGIHIADVSRYVARGSALDAEALTRGTSVYLVDRVIPMLPHALSSDLCSLVPEEDRHAVSVFVVLDGSGQVRSARFERTLIRSRHRLSYERAQAVLEGRESVDAATDGALHQLDQLARMLRRARRERGSIDFDLPEARVLLGASGEPVDIQRVVRLESHRLVEDLMLLANELVAAEAARRKLPIPYRVHDGPNDKKLQALRDFLASLGHSLPKGSPRPRDLQAVLDRVRDRPEEKLVSSVVLRSMQRARYDPRNAGHFGLAAEHYAHFTSPIRRYPDLVLHRVVVRALIQGEDVPREWGGEELEAVAERSSIRERVADEAERESVELKKIEYMEGHLGDRFHGTVSGVTSFGFFVLLDEVFVEGLVHVNALHDDYYDFREEAYALVGNRTGRRFRLGDRVQVDVARADREQRHIDFILAES